MYVFDGSENFEGFISDNKVAQDKFHVTKYHIDWLPVN